MATNEERMKILKMIQEGKITAEEGARLLAALKENRKPKAGRVNVPMGGGHGWLRVRVSDVITGKTKVNVNLPLALMDAGLRIGAQYAPELRSMDLAQLVDEVKSGASGKIIDVVDEEDGQHVEIFIE
jgi:hypothetical protein